MFSALKRLTGSNNNKGDAGVIPPGLQTMSNALQKKFARGVQYNMKIIIKGDRSVGKTCLFLRLQGQKFREEYVASEEIAVASIQWNYKATDDVVKVEVWDVVDKGRKRRPVEGLKLANRGDIEEEGPALDAEFLDVYKNTNGVIIVMDVTKAWTFEYVQRELPKVPGHIPVLVLANHCDMNHHRTLTSDHVTFYLESLERRSPVRYAEGSMRNGFGLRYLHKFLNVPFLQLQRETLLAQLATNEHETQLTLQELDLFQEKDESASYDKYLENLTSKRREVAESSGAVGGIPQPESARQPPAVKKVIEQVKKSSSVPANLVAATTKIETELVGLRLDSSIVSVEEFVPDGGGLDHSFLEDTPPESSSKLVEDSESEPETENPLVAGFQEDVDPDSVVVVRPVSVSSTEDISATTATLNCDWLLPDNKIRRSSPEGREEEDGESLSTREPTSKHKSKKSEKKKKKKKGASRKQERDDLEDFLNGSSCPPDEDAYEAL